MLTASNGFQTAILPGITAFRRTAARVTIHATESTDTVATIASNTESETSVVADILNPPPTTETEGTPGGYESDVISDANGSFTAPRPIYVAGEVTKRILRYETTTMDQTNTWPEYIADIRCMVQDSTSLFIGGGTYVYRYRILDGVKVGEYSYGGPIDVLYYDGSYLYVAGWGGKIHKVNPVTMSKVMESAAYGGAVQHIVGDGTCLYVSGANVYKIFKYQTSNMSKVDESASYVSPIGALMFDGTFLYAGSDKIYKYSTGMDLLDQSVTTNSIRSLLWDGTYIYAGGFGTADSNHKIGKFDASDMSLVAESDAYDGLVNTMSYDGTYIYAAGLGSATHKVYKYELAGLTKIDETADYGGEIWAILTPIIADVFPTITMTYSSPFLVPGMTLWFDGTIIPVDFTVTVVNGDVVLQTVTIEDNTDNFLIIPDYLNPDSDPADKIVITITKINTAYERVRIIRLFAGMRQEYSPYGDEGFYKLSTIHEADHSGLALPSGEARVIVDNISGDYNPFTPAGFAAWLQVGAIMTTETGVYVTATTREWIKTGTYWFAEWREVGYKQVELLGKDTIGYYGPLPALAQYAGWTVGSDVESYIGDVLNWAGIPANYYDVTPFPGADTAFLAGPAADIVLDELRLMAQWLMKVCVCDADGVIRFIDADIASVSTLDLDDSYQPPTVERQSLVGSIDVNIYTATLGVETEVIAIHKEVITSEQQVSIWIGWDWGDLSATVDGETSFVDLSFSYGYYVLTVTGSGVLVTITISGKKYNIAKSIYTLINSTATGSRENKITIDNPHICTRARAESIATWTLANLNKLIKLTYNWRGNPILEPLDMITAETTHGNKNIVITRQDLEFDGFLSGRIEGVM